MTPDKTIKKSSVRLDVSKSKTLRVALGGPVSLAKNRTKVSDFDAPGANVTMSISIDLDGSVETICSYRNLRAMRTNKALNRRTSHLVEQSDSVVCGSRTITPKLTVRNKLKTPFKVMFPIHQTDLQLASDLIDSIDSFLEIHTSTHEHQYGNWVLVVLKTESKEFSSIIDAFDPANTVDRDAFRVVSAPAIDPANFKLSNRMLSKINDVVLSDAPYTHKPVDGKLVMTCGEMSVTVPYNGIAPNLRPTSALIVDGLERECGIDSMQVVSKTNLLRLQSFSGPFKFEVFQCTV